jgi:acyl carrier protein
MHVDNASYQVTIIRVATQMGLINSQGELLAIDSLTMIDLLVALEEAVGFEIPITNVRENTFNSIDAISELVAASAPSA